MASQTMAQLFTEALDLALRINLDFNAAGSRLASSSTQLELLSCKFAVLYLRVKLTSWTGTELVVDRL